ncbi:MAG: hypothetical protein HYR62_09610 [Actinobacteria bacterium]|nr:hypothetical protein [Actinomycetota bacterium]MBI3687989.1 hypothetical protein [Actinomycetota bacterium]
MTGRERGDSAGGVEPMLAGWPALDGSGRQVGVDLAVLDWVARDARRFAESLQPSRSWILRAASVAAAPGTQVRLGAESGWWPAGRAFAEFHAAYEQRFSAFYAGVAGQLGLLADRLDRANGNYREADRGAAGQVGAAGAGQPRVGQPDGVW